MKARILIALLGFIFVIWTSPVYAQPPSLPHAFYGGIEIKGSPAPVGTEVEARGEGVLTGIEGNPIVTTKLGKYGGAGPLEPKLVVQGDIADGTTLTFYVNGVAAKQTAEWHSGAITELDLTVTIPGPRDGRDTTPPRISDISVYNITETSADISWKTHEKSDSRVEYWSGPHKFSPLDTKMVFSHLVHLADLTPGTTYHFKAMSTDAADNLAVSDEHTFTTLGEPPAAAFACSDLSISLSEVNIGETVTISVLIANTGDAAGSYRVTLKINGTVEATKDVTLNAGGSEEVTFTIAKDVAGSYSVDLDGLSGSFMVKEKPTAPALPAPSPPSPPSPEKPVNWPLISGVVGGLVALGLLIYFFAVRRRKTINITRDDSTRHGKSYRQR